MPASSVYYFDNNATTRVAPEVVEEMQPFFTERWGNPSSAYRFGNRLTADIAQAHARVAGLINADPEEVVFTSCGTESNNAAFHSALITQPDKRHIITTEVEHSANMTYGEFLQEQGYEVTFLPVERDGTLDLDRLRSAVRADTALVSLMWANNETGVIFPIADAAALCREKGVLIHTDAVQAAGKVVLDVNEAGVDFLSLSAHKLYAPKGIGMLFVRRGVKFQPYILGGGQERGRRGGTENVAFMAGFGRAAQLARDRLELEMSQTTRLRDRMEQTLLEKIPGASVNGAKQHRLGNTTSMAFESVEAESILLMLDLAGICASSGSACSTGAIEPSHVLTAMGMDPMRARGTVRLSLGIYNTDDEVDYLLEKLPPIIAKLRSQSPL